MRETALPVQRTGKAAAAVMQQLHEQMKTSFPEGATNHQWRWQQHRHPTIKHAAESTTRTSKKIPNFQQSNVANSNSGADKSMANGGTRSITSDCKSKLKTNQQSTSGNGGNDDGSK